MIMTIWAMLLVDACLASCQEIQGVLDQIEEGKTEVNCFLTPFLQKTEHLILALSVGNDLKTFDVCWTIS